MTGRMSQDAFMIPDGRRQSWCGFPPVIWNTVFPMQDCKEPMPKAMEFSAELCSETADYNLDCPSDITLWINGIEAGTLDLPFRLWRQTGEIKSGLVGG